MAAPTAAAAGDGAAAGAGDRPPAPAGVPQSTPQNGAGAGERPPPLASARPPLPSLAAADALRVSSGVLSARGPRSGAPPPPPAPSLKSSRGVMPAPAQNNPTYAAVAQ